MKKMTENSLNAEIEAAKKEMERAKKTLLLFNAYLLVLTVREDLVDQQRAFEVTELGNALVVTAEDVTCSCCTQWELNKQHTMDMLRRSLEMRGLRKMIVRVPATLSYKVQLCNDAESVDAAVYRCKHPHIPGLLEWEFYELPSPTPAPSNS